jgi:hypothetical protein
VTLFSPEGVSLFFPDRVRGFLSSNRACVWTGQASGIGYSPCVDRSGIPTAEEPNKTAIQNARQRRPGGLRVLGPKAAAPRLHQRNGLDFEVAQVEGCVAPES